MKIQLDTTEKIIRLEETVEIGELLKILDRLLPNDEWKKFKLETNSIINWVNPIVIEPYKYPYPYPYYPWVTYDDNISSNSYDDKKSTYSIDVII